MKAVRLPSSSITTYGKSFASFGEIIQGRLSDGEDFLVTLPVNMWSHCALRWTPKPGGCEVFAPLPKAKQAALALLKKMRISHGFSITLEFQRNIPIGKGLSSSTADILAVVRAFQLVFGLKLKQSEISELLAEIEPHDALHFSHCVAYNHRQGRLLKALEYVPQFHIIGIDSGGEVSTESYNKQLHYNNNELKEYDILYQSLLTAFAQQDDTTIAQCAQKSATMHARKTGNSLLSGLLAHVDSWRVMGLIATHSGTCAGVLLPITSPTYQRKKICLEAKKFGHVFETQTLNQPYLPDTTTT